MPGLQRLLRFLSPQPSEVIGAPIALQATMSDVRDHIADQGRLGWGGDLQVGQPLHARTTVPQPLSHTPKSASERHGALRTSLEVASHLPRPCFTAKQLLNRSRLPGAVTSSHSKFPHCASVSLSIKLEKGASVCKGLRRRPHAVGQALLSIH